MQGVECNVFSQEAVVKAGSFNQGPARRSPGLLCAAYFKPSYLEERGREGWADGNRASVSVVLRGATVIAFPNLMLVLPGYQQRCWKLLTDREKAHEEYRG